MTLYTLLHYKVLNACCTSQCDEEIELVSKEKNLDINSLINKLVNDQTLTKYLSPKKGDWLTRRDFCLNDEHRLNFFNWLILNKDLNGIAQKDCCGYMWIWHTTKNIINKNTINYKFHQQLPVLDDLISEYIDTLPEETQVLMINF